MFMDPSLAHDLARKLPEDVQTILRKFGPDICVAGGYVRDLLLDAEPNDIDIFGTHIDAVEGAIEEFKYDVFHYLHYTTTINAVTFYPNQKYNGPVVQFITRVYYSDHYKLIQSFDFSICQAALYWDGHQWVGITTPEFWGDLTDRTMHYTAPERDEDPGASVLRMVKFAGRGFRIPKEDVARVVGRFDAQLHGGTEEEGTERVKTAFRKIGYAGRRTA